jgi:long-subunit fatty acid transport protein
MRYRFNDGFAVHGGLRAIRTSGKVGTLPVDVDPGVGVTFGIYNMNTDTQTDYGYLIGATYEIPDIALRAELTYNSKITHDFNLQESLAVTGVGVTNLQTQMRTVKPESVNLNFQTGIAANTLLLASARWVKWTDFDITPPGLNGASLVDYTSNTSSYSLGVGRKLTDKVSGAIELGYEKSGDEPVGNLGPTDGYRSVTLSMKYQLSDKTALSGGVRYVWAGDATTSTIGSTFSDNTATGIGLKLTHQF